MAELTTPTSDPKSSCCEPDAQVSCCEPSEKDSCCGTSETGGECGCSARRAPRHPGDIRETVRGRYVATA